ncbi:Uncharacterized protein dnm_070410 [Desulfonema magnum]|uniref:Uncharacterized protein n=1 Tax=Desulfonema magnum TaxID=45655 RepID=A0A975BT36_9BACT|nr:Uncharacterized protein dnm_070410 [Desulfonema magnum]
MKNFSSARLKLLLYSTLQTILQKSSDYKLIKINLYFLSKDKM